MPITLRIRELREAKGWSQYDLAREAGVTQATISRIESRKTTGVDFEVLEKLADAFRVDPALLIVRVSNSKYK